MSKEAVGYPQEILPIHLYALGNLIGIWSSVSLTIGAVIYTIGFLESEEWRCKPQARTLFSRIMNHLCSKNYLTVSAGRMKLGQGLLMTVVNRLGHILRWFLI